MFKRILWFCCLTGIVVLTGCASGTSRTEITIEKKTTTIEVE